MMRQARVAAAAVAVWTALVAGAIPASPLAAQDARAHLADARELAAAGDAAAARVAYRRAMWEAVSALETAELGAVAAVQDPDTEEADARAASGARALAAEVLTEVLDAIVGETDWAAEALKELRATFPGSPMVLRLEGELALRKARFEDALAAYARLVSRRPADPALHRRAGEILLAMDRPADALDAYTRALELEPEDAATFGTLLWLHRDTSSLDALLEQVRRIARRFPESRALAEREVEVLHRMGRLEEAAEAARRIRDGGG